MDGTAFDFEILVEIFEHHLLALMCVQNGVRLLMPCDVDGVDSQVAATDIIARLLALRLSH